MSIRTALFALIAAAGVLSANSAKSEEVPDGWIDAASTKSFQWLAKSKSGRLIKADEAKDAYRYVYQKKDLANNTYTVGTIFVTLDTCRKGYGFMYYNDMEGNYVDKDPFVRYGRTVADALGSLACRSWDEHTGKVSMADKGDTWELITTATKSGNKYSLKTDTVRKLTYNGKPAVAALFRYEKVKENTFSYSEYVISAADCKQGYGTIHQLDLAGKLIEKNNVVRSGESVISGVSDGLCGKL